MSTLAHFNLGVNRFLARPENFFGMSGGAMSGGRFKNVEFFAMSGDSFKNNEFLRGNKNWLRLSFLL